VLRDTVEAWSALTGAQDLDTTHTTNIHNPLRPCTTYRHHNSSSGCGYAANGSNSTYAWRQQQSVTGACPAAAVGNSGMSCSSSRSQGHVLQPPCCTAPTSCTNTHAHAHFYAHMVLYAYASSTSADAATVTAAWSHCLQVTQACWFHWRAVWSLSWMAARHSWCHSHTSPAPSAWHRHTCAQHRWRHAHGHARTRALARTQTRTVASSSSNSSRQVYTDSTQTRMHTHINALPHCMLTVHHLHCRLRCVTDGVWSAGA
jgi:hypothetical protein